MAVDLTSVTKYFTKAQDGFSTTLASTINSSDTTISYNSFNNYTNGDSVFHTLDATDASGTATPAKREVVYGEKSGVDLINVVRAVEGAAQSHTAGANIADYVTASHWSALNTGLLVEHEKTGTHKSEIITSRTADTAPAHNDLIVTSDTSASGALKKVELEKLGWLAFPAGLTFGTFTSGTKILTLTGSSLTDTFSNGMRLKFTDAGPGTTHAIVHKVEAGTVHALIEDGKTPTGAVSDVFYSTQYAPLGFDADASKWELILEDTQRLAQASPTSGTWYSKASIELSVGVGSWNMYYQVNAQYTGTDKSISSTLSKDSTSAVTNSETTIYTSVGGSSFAISPHINNSKATNSAASTFRILISTGAGVTQIEWRGNLGMSTIIRATSAYI